jgi:hypothetical protein
MRKKSFFDTFLMVCLCVIFCIGHLSAQGEGNLNDGKKTGTLIELKYLGYVGDGVIFFWENSPPYSSNSGPVVPTGVVLAPITDLKNIEFETGRITIPGGTLKDVLQMRIYLRQRVFFRNDGQNIFKAHSLPVIELESPIFYGLQGSTTEEILNGVLSISLPGLHVSIGKGLVSGENGHNSRGNFDEFTFSAADFDQAFGEGIGKEIFKNNLTVRLRVINEVQGVSHFVVGTSTKIYGN